MKNCKNGFPHSSLNKSNAQILVMAQQFELDWSTSVVKDYQNKHKFDYVLFLNSKDSKGGYELIDSENVHPNLSLKGSEEPSSITIWAQDGLPRWTATSVI